jgi:presenilin-like A22 family membrane protease
MKKPIIIPIIILGMFILAQIIGIIIANIYLNNPLPPWFQSSTDTDATTNLFGVIGAVFFGVLLIFLFMRFKAEVVLRYWFFIIISLALGVSINALMLNLPYSYLISLLIAIPFAILKVFKRNIIVHNITELLIYPGISAAIIPLFNITTIVIFFIFISLYDIYAVWHAGFMQKMAKYQIQKVRVFSGFFVPYILPKDKKLLKSIKKSKKNKKIKVNVGLLGGGDIVFPIILSGVVLNTFGIVPAIIISLGATIALGILFYFSEKGKFYPAMPFITAGCFLALGVVYLLQYLS